MRWLLACLVLWSRLVGAQTVSMISDIETARNAPTTSFEFREAGTVASVALIQGGRCYDASNGGAATSFNCLSFTPAASQTTHAVPQAREDVDIDLNLNTDFAVLTFAFHPQTPPATGSVTLAEWDMGTTNAGGQAGGVLLWNSDRTVTLTLGGTTIGTTVPLRERQCTGLPFQTCDGTAGQCPSTCETCNGTTGAGCAWVFFELIQRNTFGLGSETVTLDLWLNGEHLIDAVSTAFSMTAGTKIRRPVLGTKTTVTSASATWLVDAVRIGTGDGTLTAADARLGWGPIYTLHPTGQEAETNMAANACASTAAWTCLDDWTGGAAYGTAGSGTGDTARLREENDVGLFTFSTATITNPTAVGTVVVGRTSTDNFTFTFDQADAECPGCSIGPPTASATLDDSTTHLAWFVEARRTGPTGPWTQTRIDNYASRLRHLTETVDNAFLRVGALLAYVAHSNPDVVQPSNIPDRNGDGTKMVCGIANSLGAGTFSFVCKTDSAVACTQDDYAEWDSTKDKPLGGCDGDDTVTRTCTLRRAEANGGAGYVCTGTAPFACGDGSCTDNVCDNNQGVFCDDNFDCDGLGSCPAAADAECVPTCPEADGTTNYDRTCTTDANCLANERCASVHGSLKCIGDCPETGLASWTLQLCGQLPPDTVCASFAQGSERFPEYVLNRHARVRLGKLQGADTLVRGTGQCTCTVNGDCPGGGTCTSGVCVGGTACTDGDNCPTGTCDAPDCDVMVFEDGTNDSSDADHDPQCRVKRDYAGAPYVLPACQAWCATETTCDDHGDCTAVNGPDALCRGDIVGGISTNNGVHGTTGNACHVVTECVSNICWDADADSLGGRYHLGLCGCTVDTECPTGHVCRDADLGTGGTQGICRKSCTSNPDCGSGSCVTNVCLGTCSCPCSAKMCSEGTPCPTITAVTDAFGWVTAQTGECIAGRCANCGESLCELGPTQAVKNAGRKRTLALHRAAIKLVEQEPDATDPMLVFATTPLLSLTRPNCTDTFIADGGAPVDQGPLVSLMLGGGLPWDDRQFLIHNAAVMRADTRLKHVVDLQAMYDRDRSRTSAWHSDSTHLILPGAGWWGGKLAGYVGTLASCAKRAGNIETVVQKYCREPDGDWQSPAVGCTIASNCTTGNKCENRACTTNDDNGTTGCPLTSPVDFCNVP